MGLNDYMVEVATGQRLMWAEDFLDLLRKSSYSERSDFLRGVYSQFVMTLKSKDSSSTMTLESLVIDWLMVECSEGYGAIGERLGSAVVKIFRQLPANSKHLILDVLNVISVRGEAI